jgi:hypothetical protein
MATREPTAADAETESALTPDLETATDATEVGDLDPECPLYKYVVGNVVHFVGVDCEAMKSQAAEPRRTTAGAMWDDTPICRFCRKRASEREVSADAA